MELVPIKVKIGLRANGHADHPLWTLLPMIIKKEDEKQYMPFGWVYDKSCGHTESRMEGNSWDSPMGMQWGCLLVTEAFAQEAITTFPSLISQLTEDEFEDFYDNKAMAHLSENSYNMQELEGLKLEYDLRMVNAGNVSALKAKIAKAVDPADLTPGIIKNTGRKWADKKIAIDVIIKAKTCKIY